MKLKARPLTLSAVPPRDAAALPSTRVAGGVASMHAAYEEEDERVLKEICPRGNNKVVIYISLYHHKYLLFMLELY